MVVLSGGPLGGEIIENWVPYGILDDGREYIVNPEGFMYARENNSETAVYVGVKE